MKNVNNYRVLSCEGGDQVGKADAIITLGEQMLLKGISITSASFPIYATPIGNTIRIMLKNGGGEFGLSHEDELIIKMALFALNRLEFLDIFLSEEKYKRTLIVFDRSAFSNALTIAYAISTIPRIDEKKIKETVDLALRLDSLFIDSLNLKNCVVQLVSKQKNWKNTRGKGADLHESTEVQARCDHVYEIYEGRVGPGWGKIVTRENGNWREREDIFNDIEKFVFERLGEFEMSKKPQEFEVGIKGIQKNIYCGSRVNARDLDKYLNSIRENDKEAMYFLSVGIKDAIVESCEEVCFRNKCVRKVFKSILEEFPQIVDILCCNVGEEFVHRLVKGLER